MTRLRTDISVIVSTRNRAQQLEQMLWSIERQELEDQTCELVVVDNGSTDSTQSVLNRNWTRMPIIPLCEKAAGKSRALNRALDVARGGLIVFTDDDVTASPHWLRSLHQAFVKHGSAAVFCGPIVPSFPPGTPKWLQVHRLAGPMFARFEPDLPEGVLPLNLLPFGPNFAVRSSAVGNMRFNLALGPSKENGPLFSEDTEFVYRLRQQSQQFIFVPSARVTHHIARFRIEPQNLFERAFHLGRANVAVEMNARYCNVSFYKGQPNQEYEQRLEVGGILNFYCGQLYQFRALGDSSFDHELMEALEHLEIEANEELLGESARSFYARIRQDSKRQRTGVPTERG